ncbi:MAG: hypothetical protein NUV53_01490 [Patescibacteria group bacterium]|nr:hypothetical protein [Patescibacteria group bacterium]
MDYNLSDMHHLCNRWIELNALQGLQTTHLSLEMVERIFKGDKSKSMEVPPLWHGKYKVVTPPPLVMSS